MEETNYFETYQLPKIWNWDSDDWVIEVINPILD